MGQNATDSGVLETLVPKGRVILEGNWQREKFNDLYVVFGEGEGKDRIVRIAEMHVWSCMSFGKGS